MQKRNIKVGAFVASMVGTAGLVGGAVAGTGAYFSDTHPGTVAGTMGSIRQSVVGSQITFTKLLPGEAQSKKVSYTNIGDNAQDVWLVFDPSTLGDGNHNTDTGLINDRGTFASVQILSNGSSVFSSSNLNDDATSCPPGTGTPACNPLPEQLQLASNVAPGASGDFTFTYATASRASNAWEDAPAFQPISYTIVATQPGIAPNAS